MAFLAFGLNGQDLSASKTFSLGLHGAEAIVGNYGFTLAIKLASHLELTIPLEFYSFSHSLPGWAAFKIANRVANGAGLDQAPRLTMYHAKAGIGARLFVFPQAMRSGFYIQPILYGGWLNHTDFSSIEFDNRQEAINALLDTVYKDLPEKSHFALSPQLNIGYQWISEAGFLLQLAAYANYVYAPSADTIFNASDRFFSSNAVGDANKSNRWSKTAIDSFRIFGTQVNGWHAGLMFNLGMAI